MTAIFVITLALPALGLWLRGSAFHNRLVKRCAQTLQDAGFNVALECPVEVAEGGTDFIDIMAWRGPVMVACEVETTPRNVVVNAERALDLGLLLYVVVPNRRVRSAAINRLRRRLPGANWQRIWILLPDEVSQVVTNCIPSFPSANEDRKNRKTNQGDKACAFYGTTSSPSSS